MKGTPAVAAAVGMARLGLGMESFGLRLVQFVLFWQERISHSADIGCCDETPILLLPDRPVRTRHDTTRVLVLICRFCSESEGDSTP